MEYQKIPLEEQFQSIENGFCIHPEYIACTIRLWGKMSIADYLGSNTEEGKQRLNKLMNILRIPEKKGRRMTYCDIAERINSLKQEGNHGRIVKKAIHLLAQPLEDGYELWRGGQKNAENPA